MHILLVCTGNVSRSFAAEMLLRNEIERLHLDAVSVSSGGLSAFPGSPPDPKMLEYLLKMDVPVRTHQAKQLSQKDVDFADLILVMEREHAEAIGRLWPGSGEKVELLGKFLSEGPFADDIPDPYGRSEYHYRSAQSQITLAIKSFVKKVLANQANRST